MIPINAITWLATGPTKRMMKTERAQPPTISLRGIAESRLISCGSKEKLMCLAAARSSLTVVNSTGLEWSRLTLLAKVVLDSLDDVDVGGEWLSTRNRKLALEKNSRYAGDVM